MEGKTHAEQLEGAQLDGGWMVGRKLDRPKDSSGGHFSVGYVVTKGKLRAFLKALDVNSALGDGGLQIAHILTGGQWSEVELLERCAQAGLSRIVRPLCHGIYKHPHDPSVTPVPYIITEWADGGDLSRAIGAGDDLLFCLRAVHGIAAAVKQLHTWGIVHRDIRPSNGLLVDGRVKLGDLGHAVDLGCDVRVITTPGLLAYAPPEVLYRSQRPGQDAQRLADLYLLGSLILSAAATRVPLTTLWVSILEDVHQPNLFGGSLSQIMPFVRDAYGKALDFAEARVPVACDKGRLMLLVRRLTDPDPDRRGYPEQRSGSGTRMPLERVVTELDLLHRRAEIALRRPNGPFAF